MSQMSLFDNSIPEPLAARLRPESFDEYVGQEHLVGPGKIIRRLVESDQISSMIFWGPPGVGKTTLAQIIANSTKAQFITFSAVTSGIKEIKEVMNEADRMKGYGQKTIVFVDEIHRFNKAQQDAFLPFVERGTIILIGATTENPSFEVNSALLSRCKVFVLKGLTKSDIKNLLIHALESPKGFGGQKILLEEDLLGTIASYANGDARMALSTLEMAVLNGNMASDGTITVTRQIIEMITGKKALLYDKNGEEHYNLISALHKSMRNSDPDAAVYWLARMLEAGEDPIYIARRVTRFAAEDVGLADPNALTLAVSAYQACHFIGVPECNVHLTEAIIYLALAPKSNSMETAYLKAKDDAVNDLAEPVPLVIRNAPTGLMDELGYGHGYKYAHDYEDKITDIQCLPDNLIGTEYYNPGNQGAEIKFKERLEQIKKWREEHQSSGN